MIDAFRDFLKLETASGILLVAAAVLAMVIANSPLAPLYGALIDLPVGVRVGALEIEKPLLLWINDGLMAVFFFLVGLELKREILDGQLSDPREIVLPALGALGGMLVPAAIYIWVNQGDSTALQGWAIPAATDIAFALAILAMLGSRVPLSLKIFLVSVAIFDDVGAIVIIALFYTSDLSVAALVTAACCVPVLWALNRRGVLEFAPYLLVGLIMWVAVLKSGVHATLAGVLLAFFVPLRDREKERSPLHEIEHDLHTAVAFGILPVFAFANAGIALGGLSFESCSPCSTRNNGRSFRWQAGRRIRVLWPGCHPRDCASARRSALGAHLRHRTSLRRRFYNEPVHRIAGVRGNRRKPAFR